MRFSILKKFLVAFLIISITPLFVLSFYARENLFMVGENALESSRKALLEHSASLLEARARAIARQVELLLKLCEDDLNALALLPFEPDLYLSFSNGHQRHLWIRVKMEGRIEVIRPKTPLYLELTYVDPEGVERIRILENRIFPGGRHVRVPFRGSFGREDYFNAARHLYPGEIYVSRLLGQHVRKEEQLQGAETVENAVGGRRYRGIIRFAAPVYRNNKFAGVVSLALDHRHLMEYTQHVQPIGNREVVFPSYTSGNYAFLFDDEGWIITHPKFWDIRGYDRGSGLLIDPASDAYNEVAIKKGCIPFNLLHVPFIHENYGFIANEALAGRSGVTQTSSVGQVPRVMAYAPIRFNSGEYRATGFFGGVTLGAKTEFFYQAIEKTAADIHRTQARTVRHFGFIILATGVLVMVLAILLAQSFSRSIRLLSQKAEQVSQGQFDVAVEIKSGDELEFLGHNFQQMAERLEVQRQKIIHSLEAVKTSKREAVKERDFIKSVFANVVSGLMVIDENRVITTVNHNIEEILDIPFSKMQDSPVEEAFAVYPEILEQIRRVLNGGETRSVDLRLKMPGPRKFIELTVSYLKGAHPPDDRALLIIIRDITRRKQMERYLSRSDRLVSLGTLAAGVAHEIRNPLTGITLMLDDLHDRMTHSEADRLLMQKALNEIEKLENIITELLDFASKPSGDYARTDINTVIDNTLFLIKKQCNRQQVSLYRETPPLPPLTVNPEKMKQALLNILLNALNVMPDGGELHIYTFLQENLEMFTGKKGIEIRICDTGPGVDPIDMDYIFDPFYTRTPKGSGLGLSITHTIIEEHRGKIVVDSKLGRGACFKIFFPIDEEETDDEERENPGRG